MTSSELNTARLSDDQFESIHGSERFSVPSTEQLLLYHGPELFTSVVSYSPVAHLVVSVDGRILRVNDVFHHLTRSNDLSLAGLPLTSIMDEKSRDLTDRMLDRLRSKREANLEWVASFLRDRGDPISLSLNGVVVWLGGKPRYITILARSLPATPKYSMPEVVGGDTFRSLVERIPAVIYITDLDPNVGTTYISPQLESMLGYSQDEWLSNPGIWVDVLFPDDREAVLAEIERARAERGGYLLEHRVMTHDGRMLWVRNEAALVQTPKDGTLCWHGVIYDVSDRKRLEEDLGHSEARFRSLVQNTSGVVLVVERDGSILYSSPSLGEWIGEPHPLVLSCHNCLDLLHADDVSRFRQFLIESAAVSGISPDIEVRMRNGGGGWRHVDVVATNLTEDQEVQGIVLNARDITERRDLQDLLSHQAFHDPLTDLANRALFLDRLGHALDRASRLDQIVGLLFLDIDNFKLINDTQGHETGDQLLIAVAKRLCDAVRNVDTVARMGGDEFTVLLEDLSGIGDAIQTADRIAKSLSEPFILPADVIKVSASIGIAHSGSRKMNPEDLMRAADIALYRAKNLGKARYAVFERGMTAPIHERLALEHDLKGAIERDEIEVHFQPFVDLTNGFVHGVEALMRWRHAERGLLLPEDFVGISEASGLIVELGKKILHESCRQVRAWQERDKVIPPLSLSVNLSTFQFRHPSIVDDVAGILRETGFPAEFLVLEITESLFMGNSGQAVDVLHELKRLGLRLFVDDFGTGYSSLSFLKRFPLDGLKIDRSFIAGLDRDSQNQRLVAAIIAAGQALDLDVVAEGIETIGQLGELRGLGCSDGQGHLFASPGPAEEIAPLVHSRVLLPQVRVLRDQSRRLSQRPV